jgi:serine/threonine protein kinase
LIHRDLKPANIWMETPADRVKLLDFGMVRNTEAQVRLTQTGAILGTPQYMAPEQANGEAVDCRCDLFSLGVILYRLCSAEMPFKGDSIMSLLTALAVSTPKSLHERRPDLPAPLADLIMQLLAKKPEDRPSSARVVEEVLMGLADNVLVGTPA